MFNSEGGGGKLPNANCDQITKWKYPKLPTRNVRFWGGGEKLLNANCDQTTKWKYPKLPTRNVRFWGVSKLPNANCHQTTKWKYPKLLTRNVRVWWGGGSVNYQMQIVIKLPNENIQNYQLDMFDSDGRAGKLPNANCDQTTKWKYPKLPTRNVWFWRVSKLPNANCDQITKWKYPKLPTRNFWFSGGGV